jgi:hypothetical protein
LIDIFQVKDIPIALLNLARASRLKLLVAPQAELETRRTPSEKTAARTPTMDGLKKADAPEMVTKKSKSTSRTPNRTEQGLKKKKSSRLSRPDPGPR